MAHTEHARQVFEEEASHGFDQRLRGVRGTFRFDVIDVGSWHVAIDDGRVAIREGAGAPAECVVEGPESDLVAILTGELRAIIAFMQGRVRLRGDMALFTRFHGWAGSEGGAQPMAEQP
ncbi:MAG: SCP2 sterol-binding domain-containing protein [Myxococcales bacterium]|nr:SCP2 sterol-binding domain-containing protein [Myxococcales bacterium]